MDDPRQNPYVGPRSFEEEHQRLFFGRDEESRQLTALIIAHRAVLFYAQSGTGKTSLLNASVVPELKRRKKVHVLPMSRVGGDLPPGLAPGRVDNIFVFNTLLHLTPEVDPSRLAGLDLVEGLLPALEAQEDESRARPCLLILDQFEELFTQHPDRQADKAGFFDQMGACLEAYPNLSLLLSMREDYIAHLDPFAGQLPDRLRTRFRMERLNVRGALSAVKEPAALAGRTFADGVAESLVDNLRRIQVGEADPLQESASQPLGDYVEPVHLQIVCQQLWAGLPPGEDGIRAEDLKEFGDVDQALASFYERILVEVQRKTGVSERRMRNWIEEKLITSAGTRGLAYQGQDEAASLPQEAVQELYEAYLIRTEVRSGAVWYELSHDRLIEPILASNAAWRRTELQPFQRQAEAWSSSGRPASLLLREKALEEAEAWAGARAGQLLPFEKEFLDTSRQINERETLEREIRSAQQLRRIGRLAFAETVYFVLSIVLLVIGLFLLFSTEFLTTAEISFISILGLLGLLLFTPLYFLSGLLLGINILVSTFRLSRPEGQPKRVEPEVEPPDSRIRAQRISARAVWLERVFSLFGILGVGWFYTRNLLTGYLGFSLYAFISLPIASAILFYGSESILSIGAFFALNLVAALVSSQRLKAHLIMEGAASSKRHLLFGLLIVALIVIPTMLVVKEFW